MVLGQIARALALVQAVQPVDTSRLVEVCGDALLLVTRRLDGGVVEEDVDGELHGVHHTRATTERRPACDHVGTVVAHGEEEHLALLPTDTGLLQGRIRLCFDRVARVRLIGEWRGG